MKIFLDTDIFLDLILKRENFKESMQILNSVEKGLFEAVILNITLLNIDYIAKKQVKDVKEFLMLVNSICTVMGADNDLFNQAFNIDNSDLEDTIQYMCAKKSKCDLIIANDKSFYHVDIDVIDSKKFVERYL